MYPTGSVVSDYNLFNMQAANFWILYQTLPFDMILDTTKNCNEPANSIIQMATDNDTHKIH